MNEISQIGKESLPSLVSRAAEALASAKTSAEVLEARDVARVAYDAAKSAGRMARAKKAHDEVIGAVYRAQADALLIEARAKARLADEYDAAQERGEVSSGGNPTVVDANGCQATAADLGLRRDEIHEARQIRDAERAQPGVIEAAISEKVDSGQEPTKATVRQTAEAVNKPFVANNSGNNEWYTPDLIIDAARSVLGGIFLDPASSAKANECVKATIYMTAEDDGLVQPWPEGGTVWMNPPYSQPLISKFCEKLATHCERSQVASISLVNNATETGWFQRLAGVSSAICFPKSRIRFLDPDGNPGAPLQGQALIYCGPSPEKFSRHFSRFGLVVRHG